MTRAREAARLIGNNTFRLDSNNAVGFNSTTPDAMFDINRGLTVAGVSTFSGNVTMSGDLTVQGTTTTLDTTLQEVDLINVQANASVPAIGVTQSGSGNLASFYDGATEVFTIADGGGVGINRSAPTSVLDVRQTNTGAATEIKLFNLDQSNATTQTAALVMTPDVRANGVKIVAVKEVADMSSTANKDLALTFQTVENNAAAEKLRITSAGLVGVSTASPEAKLHLYNGISGAADADGSGILVIENSNHASIQFKTPTDKKGLIFFGDADSATSGRIEYDHNNDSMVVNTAGSTRLKLNTGGATITGICTATSFVGSGANLTGLPAGFTELDAALFN